MTTLRHAARANCAQAVAGVIDLLGKFSHQQIVVHPVKELLQIQVHHDPTALGNVLPRRLDRLMGLQCRHLLWPLLTSARASRHLTMSVAQGTLADLYEPPRV